MCSNKLTIFRTRQKPHMKQYSIKSDCILVLKNKCHKEFNMQTMEETLFNVDFHAKLRIVLTFLGLSGLNMWDC